MNYRKDIAFIPVVYLYTNEKKIKYYLSSIPDAKMYFVYSYRCVKESSIRVLIILDCIQSCNNFTDTSPVLVLSIV